MKEKPSPDKDSRRAPTVLVVDDSPADRKLAGIVIEGVLGWRAVYADNGRSALEEMAREEPQLVLTDMKLPDLDGLGLVAAIGARHQRVPVVLVTAQGDEATAVQALQSGAACYVPRRVLEQDLAPTLRRVLAAAQVERRQERLLGQLKLAELHFALDNDPSLILPLVLHLQQHLVRMGLCDAADKVRVGVALEEALLNAMFHGNLEVSSDVRREGEEPYQRLAEERSRRAPYRDRRVYCTARLGPDEAVFVIRDEGPGFDLTQLPDPTDTANLDRVGGRGLLLIRMFMDEVAFNQGGNEITLVKRRSRAPQTAR
jgi:CheY-like chemotaxis protein/anti-sigma regulatory factor (Ser/Thr protein kinase)